MHLIFQIQIQHQACAPLRGSHPHTHSHLHISVWFHSACDQQGICIQKSPLCWYSFRPGTILELPGIRQHLQGEDILNINKTDFQTCLSRCLMCKGTCSQDSRARKVDPPFMLVISLTVMFSSGERCLLGTYLCWPVDDLLLCYRVLPTVCSYCVLSWFWHWIHSYLLHIKWMPPVGFLMELSD